MVSNTHKCTAHMHRRTNACAKKHARKQDSNSKMMICVFDSQEKVNQKTALDKFMAFLKIADEKKG